MLRQQLAEAQEALAREREENARLGTSLQAERARQLNTNMQWAEEWDELCKCLETAREEPLRAARRAEAEQATARREEAAVQAKRGELVTEVSTLSLQVASQLQELAQQGQKLRMAETQLREGNEEQVGLKRCLASTEWECQALRRYQQEMAKQLLTEIQEEQARAADLLADNNCLRASLTQAEARLAVQGGELEANEEGRRVRHEQQEAEDAHGVLNHSGADGENFPSKEGLGREPSGVGAASSHPAADDLNNALSPSQIVAVRRLISSEVSNIISDRSTVPLQRGLCPASGSTTVMTATATTLRRGGAAPPTATSASVKRSTSAGGRGSGRDSRTRERLPPQGATPRRGPGIATGGGANLSGSGCGGLGIGRTTSAASSSMGISSPAGGNISSAGCVAAGGALGSGYAASGAAAAFSGRSGGGGGGSDMDLGYHAAGTRGGGGTGVCCSGTATVAGVPGSPGGANAHRSLLTEVQQPMARRQPSGAAEAAGAASLGTPGASARSSPRGGAPQPRSTSPEGERPLVPPSSVAAASPRRHEGAGGSFPRASLQHAGRLPRGP